jgi:hypothetical protein
MKASNFGRYAVCSCVAATMLAGCGGSQPPIGAPGAMPPQVAAFSTGALGPLPRADGGWLSPRARTGKGLVYVSDEASNAIFIFDKQNLTRGPIGKITDEVHKAAGLAVDRQGALYVADAGDDTVRMYPRGSTKPSVKYTDGISHPIGLAISPDTGRLYVANFKGLDVTEYPQGSITPDKTVYFDLYEGNSPYGVTLDSNDVPYVTALGFPTAQAYKLPLHQDWPKDLRITKKWAIIFGIAVDKKGDVIVANQSPEAIYIYPPHSHRPSKKIAVSEPLLIALDEPAGRLYVANVGYYLNAGSLLVYSYPQCKLLTQIHRGRFFRPVGVAVTQ